MRSKLSPFVECEGLILRSSNTEERMAYVTLSVLVWYLTVHLIKASHEEAYEAKLRKHRNEPCGCRAEDLDCGNSR